MSIETEKKYRLDEASWESVKVALLEMGAEYIGCDREENNIYTSEKLRHRGGVIRVRRIGDRSILTYKRRIESNLDIKTQIEYETEVEDAASLTSILAELDIVPRLLYEKYRDIWKFRSVEIVLDRLPFGLFMEIEGSITGIKEAEILLGIEDLESVRDTYPALTLKHGTVVGNIIEARFTDEV